MQSLREQHQRMHQKRQGQYPLEQKEEYYENELKEKESKYVLPFNVVHGRSHSLDTHKDTAHGLPVPSFPGDPNRYSHYMNYKEIQQHINQRVQHDMRNSSSKKISKSEPKTTTNSAVEGPSSNFFDYESVHHHHQRHTTSQSSDISSNSLPRGVHTSDHALTHQGPMNKPYFVHEAHDNGNYGRMNVHHFYPNTKLYSHIVPGSKV
ncbi:uncharacterized protein LOC118203341 [Stegodyphus dumicola]|uniref:uncharacterized protein LOC118203341 n=1 Tax=Stegodyphus dumicola TaxID=202533 RepID=UPI0015AD46EC|nr:uncharacterized protein LOC118203341 [Stegodyphus dumicola]